MFIIFNCSYIALAIFLVVSTFSSAKVAIDEILTLVISSTVFLTEDEIYLTISSIFQT